MRAVRQELRLLGHLREKLLANLERHLVFVPAILAQQHGNAVHAGNHGFGHVHRQDIADPQIQQFAHQNLPLQQFDAHFHFGLAHFSLQGLDPAVVDLAAVCGHAGGELVADGFDHAVRDAHVQATAAALDLDIEGGDDDHLGRGGDVDELRVDFGARELGLQRQHGRPGGFVFLEHHVEHALDDALLQRGKVAALDAGVKAAISPEKVVDHAENQPRVEDEQRGSAQRFHLHQIEIAGHDQAANELVVLGQLHRRHRDFRGAPQKVEQTHPPQPGEALVDDFQRGHAPAHDAVLAGQVVRTHAPFIRRLRFGHRLFA